MIRGKYIHLIFSVWNIIKQLEYIFCFNLQKFKLIIEKIIFSSKLINDNYTSTNLRELSMIQNEKSQQQIIQENASLNEGDIHMN